VAVRFAMAARSDAVADAKFAKARLVSFLKREYLGKEKELGQIKNFKIHRKINRICYVKYYLSLILR